MKQFAAIVFLSLGAACAHQETPPAQPAASSTAPADPNAQQPKATNASSDATMPCSADNQCRNDSICVNSTCTLVSAALSSCVGPRVHFPFNSADLEDKEKAGLVRAARCLQASQAMRLTIEGNADERGTEEYNLALGEKRARTVAKYLENLGASSEQLKTVSYGKEKPLCSEHDEACWSANRRAAMEMGRSN